MKKELVQVQPIFNSNHLVDKYKGNIVGPREHPIIILIRYE